MAAAAPYYRVPVVIFAVLIGALYVYAKGGESLFGSRTHVTPAADAKGDEFSAPRIEFMMGPKSAPAFDRVPQPQPARLLLPGSKSAGVVDPSVFTPAPQPAYSQQQAAPAKAVPNRTRVLPGSKSMILIEPEALVPAARNSPPQQRYQQPARQQRQSP